MRKLCLALLPKLVHFLTLGWGCILFMLLLKAGYHYELCFGLSPLVCDGFGVCAPMLVWGRFSQPLGVLADSAAPWLLPGSSVPHQLHPVPQESMQLGMSQSAFAYNLGCVRAMEVY